MYYVFKFMKKKFNIKPSQEYTNVPIYNITVYYKKLKHSKYYLDISIIVIKYSLSYKHISRDHIIP